MAFSNAPTNDTYSSKASQMLATITYEQSNEGITTGMTNVLPFVRQTVGGEDELYGVSRYGFVADDVETDTSNGSEVVGFYVWDNGTTVLTFIACIDYSGGTDTRVYYMNGSTPTLLFTASGTGIGRFCEFINDTGTKTLIYCNGTDGWVITGTPTATEITDADFPTPHVPFPVFLNGRLYLAKAGTGDIYNSNLNNPALWTAGDFISSEVYPDDVKALVKINNYILAIGQNGCEYFYDAANPTASPLARQEGASLPFGTVFTNAIAFTRDTVVMIAQDASGEASLRTIEGFKFAEIPDTFLMNQLNLARTGQGRYSAVPVNEFIGFLFRQRGELFYALTFGRNHSTVAMRDALDMPTYVYSFSTKVWSMFSVGNSSSQDYTSKHFCVYFTAPATTEQNVTYIAGNALGTSFYGRFSSIQSADSFPAGSGTPTSHAILQQIAMEEEDFGTMNKKAINRVGFLYHNTLDGTSPLFYSPRVSWSFSIPEDFTYTYQRTLPASGHLTTGDYPFITQLGTGRNIWLMFENYGANIYHRIEYDINKGQQ